MSGARKEGNGHAEAADSATRLAVLLDGKRVSGGAVILSQDVAREIQVTLEDAASAHSELAHDDGGE